MATLCLICYPCQAVRHILEAGSHVLGKLHTLPSSQVGFKEDRTWVQVEAQGHRAGQGTVCALGLWSHPVTFKLLCLTKNIGR